MYTYMLSGFLGPASGKGPGDEFHVALPPPPQSGCAE